jgi:hypothetical protein
MRACQIDIEKPGVRVSHLTAGFFYCADASRKMDVRGTGRPSAEDAYHVERETEAVATKRFTRFRLRTMFALLAIVAASSVFIPKLWHRHRVNLAIASTIESRPDISWRFDPFASGTARSLQAHCVMS